jgi:hypothetical protein
LKALLADPQTALLSDVSLEARVSCEQPPSKKRILVVAMFTNLN